MALVGKIFGAALLHDVEAGAHGLGQQLNGGRYKFAEDAGALAAAEDQQLQRAAGLRHVIGRAGQRHRFGAHRIAGVDDLRHVLGQEADQREIRRDQLHVIHHEAVGAAEQCVGRDDGSRDAAEDGRGHDDTLG